MSLRMTRIIAVAIVVVPVLLLAQSGGARDEVARAFRSFTTITPQILVPRVVEVPISRDPASLPIFAVYDATASEFIPYADITSVSRTEAGSSIEAPGALGNANALSDGKYETYIEFPAAAENARRANITFTFAQPVSASTLIFALDQYVALPQTIAIEAKRAGVSYVVLAESRLSGTSVNFPRTTSREWSVSFSYIQPLRISEMHFEQLSAAESISTRLRFLAQPGHTYHVYFGADRYVRASSKETPDLVSDEGVIVMRGTAPILNPLYAPADSDNDAIPDVTDNCVSITNADQADTDRNGRGDACEDYDRDGLVAANDNCPDITNREQQDTDADGKGDVCDEFEDRLTERLPWLPWAGIALAALVLLTLFALVWKVKPHPLPPPEESANV